jgi:hypothetical protein
VVSGSGKSHPDDDLLADLVADVLPTDQARVIESHVMHCQECTSLLADAEHVRGLLVRSDPGPIPGDLLSRLESALQFEAQGHGAPQTGVIPAGAPVGPEPVQVPNAWADTETIDAFRSGPGQQPEAETPFPLEATVPAGMTTSGAAAGRRGGPPGGGRLSRLHRPARGPSRSRRDMRQEVRDVRSGRRGTMLAAVAGVVIVLALAGFAVKGFITSSGSGTDAAGAAAGESALTGTGSGSRVVTTGTAYTETGLPDQVHALMAEVAEGGTGPDGSGDAPAATRSVAAPGSGNLGLRDPEQLKGCLTALNAGPVQPVAIDLATYEGQEAAIIVLVGDDGGYEVWVVARTCQAGADGTIKFAQIPA